MECIQYKCVDDEGGGMVAVVLRGKKNLFTQSHMGTHLLFGAKSASL